MIYRRLKYSTKICIKFINFSANNVSNIFQSILMNCNYFQQLTKDTVRNRKKVSSTLKEEICRNDSSVKDMKFHRKIAVLIPDIRSHKQHSLSKVYFRKHDEMQKFPGWHSSRNTRNQLYGLSCISE